jgi:hypothetical protein
MSCMRKPPAFPRVLRLLKRSNSGLHSPSKPREHLAWLFLSSNGIEVEPVPQRLVVEGLSLLMADRGSRMAETKVGPHVERSPKGDDGLYSVI